MIFLSFKFVLNIHRWSRSDLPYSIPILEVATLKKLRNTGVVGTQWLGTLDNYCTIERLPTFKKKIKTR